MIFPIVMRFGVRRAGWIDGRKSARMVRDFLEKAGFSREMTEEICYEMTIHVDGEADFAGERTAFARTVGDADNIDRFDAYRIYEKLQYRGFSERSLEEKKKLVSETLERLKKYQQEQFGTRTATEMCRRGRIAFLGRVLPETLGSACK